MTDDAKDLESTLKPGERGVPILPPLKALLESYLPSLKSDSVVPSPRGMQWDGDNFGDRHRTILRNNHLEWTCLIYRHTFATKRAAEGWSLFRIAKVMGNSVAVCEQHYAAYIDRSRAYE
jgi:integrase